jgi:hypothetical protein
MSLARTQGRREHVHGGGERHQGMFRQHHPPRGGAVRGGVVGTVPHLRHRLAGGGGGSDRPRRAPLDDCIFYVVDW